MNIFACKCMHIWLGFTKNHVDVSYNAVKEAKQAGNTPTLVSMKTQNRQHLHSAHGPELCTAKFHIRHGGGKYELQATTIGVVATVAPNLYQVLLLPTDF